MRKKISTQLKIEVLTEAGYRCAVPTCRSILAIDLHHINQIKDNGDNSLSNLIALCPTCHRLFHLNKISRDSLYGWKGILIALNQGFDKHAVDDLIFVAMPTTRELEVSGDGLLRFTNLISAKLVVYKKVKSDMGVSYYSLDLTPRGEQFISAWQSGNRKLLSATFESESTSELVGSFIFKWAEFENVLRKIASKEHTDGHYQPILKILEILQGVGFIGKLEIDRINELRIIRNNIVHAGQDQAGLVKKEVLLNLDDLLDRLRSKGKDAM